MSAPTAAPVLAAANAPGLPREWLHRYTEFLATKRGLECSAFTPAIRRSTDCTSYFMQRFGPALGSLLVSRDGEWRDRWRRQSEDLSVRRRPSLCQPVADEGAAYSQRMVALLMDGLRYGAVMSWAFRITAEPPAPPAMAKIWIFLLTGTGQRQRSTRALRVHEGEHDDE